MTSRTVLLTGGAGYIGSTLARQLLAEGYAVHVVDVLRAGGEALLGLMDHPRFSFRRADVRDGASMAQAMQGAWGVVHLAALVGDPACAREPDLAKQVNLHATRDLYRRAEEQGIRRFVFSSTCSNYGKMEQEDGYVDETSPLRPASLYAETKVAAETFLLEQPRTNRCVPTSLRFATVYGMSPRVRFDLTVNHFTKDLVLDRELVVFGEQFWRPYCHVWDLARSVVTVLEADADAVGFDVFNVGDTGENYRKRHIVELIQDEVPTARVRYVRKEEDPRDYRVRFDKIKARTGFEVTRDVRSGIREVKYFLENGFIVDPDDPKYYNVSPERAHAD